MFNSPLNKLQQDLKLSCDPAARSEQSEAVYQAMYNVITIALREIRRVSYRFPGICQRVKLFPIIV